MQRQFNFLIDRKCRPICPPASERERFRSAAGPSCEQKTNNMLTRRNQRHRDKYKLKAPSSPQQIRCKIVKTPFVLPTAPYPSCHVNLCLPASCSEGDVGARLFFLLRPGAHTQKSSIFRTVHSFLASSSPIPCERGNEITGCAGRKSATQRSAFVSLNSVPPDLARWWTDFFLLLSTFSLGLSSLLLIPVTRTSPPKGVRGRCMSGSYEIIVIYVLCCHCISPLYLHIL